MTEETPQEIGWQDWFAWRPVTIDGIGYWLQWVQRRKVSIGEPGLAPFSAPQRDSFWEYRVDPETLR